MALLKYPYTNLHEINLDWIIEQLNKSGPVISVNSKQGIVTLTAEDINRSTNNPQTVEQALTAQGNSIQTVRNEIGVTPLPTTAQTITGAIAEHETDITNINNDIGNTALPTIAQTLTGAIAENAVEIANQEDLIGSTALPTTAQTITGAIAEHETDITNINNKIGNTPLGTTATTLTGAIAEHEDDINAVSTGLVTLNDTKVTSGTLDIVSCRKTGKIVNVAARVHTITDGTVTATGIFFNIPAGFRPAATVYGYAYLNIDGAYVPIFATINTAGEVSINYSGSKYTTQAYFFACYAV